MTVKLSINLNDVLRQRTIEGKRVEYKAGWNAQCVVAHHMRVRERLHNLGGGYVVLGVEESRGASIPGGSKHCRTSCCVWANRPFSRITTRSRASIDRRPGDPRAVGARRRDTPVQGQSQSDARRDGVGILPSPAQQHGSNQTNRRTRNCYARPRRCRSTIATTRQPRWMNFRRVCSNDYFVTWAVALPTELSTEVLGWRMNIVGGPSEACFPKNVGLLFFNDGRTASFPQPRSMSCGFSTVPGRPLRREGVSRPFCGHSSRGDRFVSPELPQGYRHQASRSTGSRANLHPLAAIEEVLVNAIYRHSYEERELVEVRFTPEELTVLSFPSDDRLIRMEDLQSGRAVSRRYRNRRFGKFLKALDVAEGQSTGILKIPSAMHENGSPPPVFESDDDRTWFLVRLPVHEAAHRAPIVQCAERASEEVTEHDTPQVTRQVPHKSPLMSYNWWWRFPDR